MPCFEMHNTHFLGTEICYQNRIKNNQIMTYSNWTYTISKQNEFYLDRYIFQKRLLILVINHV